MNLIRSINWIITLRCNSRCIHCDIWRLKSDLTMPISNLKGILDDRLIEDSYKYYGNNFDISLGGGEPFLLNNLQEIVGAIEAKYPGSFKSITTNGFRTKSILGFVSENRGLSFKMNISVDGIGSVHDTIRGIEGSFEKVIDTVTKARKINPSQKIELKFTLLPINYNQIVKVYKLAIRLKCGFSFKPAEHIKSYTNRIKHLNLFFNEEQLCTIRNQAFYVSDQMYKENKFKEAKFFKDIPFHLFSKIRNKNCSVLNNDITIMPDGELYTCLMKPSIGHLKKGSIKDLWNIKSKTIKKCPSCLLMCGSYKDYSGEHYENKVSNIETNVTCNLNCNICSQRELQQKRHKAMGFGTLKRIIKTNPDITHVSFVGGEPFLNNDLFQMMEYLDGKAVTYEITTNGTLVDKRNLSMLKKAAGLKQINFSLDGLKKYHDGERGIGVFEKCIESIKLTKDFFKIEVCSVAKSNNLLEIFRLTKFLASLGIESQKIIIGMSLGRERRKETQKLFPYLKIQGPYFKENISFDIKKKRFLYKMIGLVEKNNSQIKIRIEPSITINNDNSLVNKFLLNDIASCRQLSQYRFNSKGKRIICEFIRNQFSSKIAAYLFKNLLPICQGCCKLDPTYEGNVNFILSNYYGITEINYIIIGRLQPLRARSWFFGHPHNNYEIFARNDKYILKQFPLNKIRDIEAFCTLHYFLKQERYPLNAIVKSLDNKEFVRHDKYYFLLIKQSEVATLIQHNFTEFKKLGSFLGRYHNSMDKFKKLYMVPKAKRAAYYLLRGQTKYGVQNSISKLNLATKKELRLIHDLFGKWEKEIKLVRQYKDINFTVVHFDFTPYNILQTSRGHLLLDYHCVKNLPRITDMSTLFSSLCLEELRINGRLTLSFFSSVLELLIESYNNVVKIRISSNEVSLMIRISFFFVLSCLMPKKLNPKENAYATDYAIKFLYIIHVAKYFKKLNINQ